MPNSQRGSENVLLDGKSLGALTFEWSGDRYQHRWCIDDKVIVHSVESDSHEAWPTSPPLQQIHQQSFGDGREVIFGVGMAGRGHWSASFTLVPDLACWIVELACRSTVEPERLMSTYRLSDDQGWHASEHPSIRVGDKLLSFEAITPGACTEEENSYLRVLPANLGSGTTTTQWAFRLRVT